MHRERIPTPKPIKTGEIWRFYWENQWFFTLSDKAKLYAIMPRFYKKYAMRGKLFQCVSDAVKDAFIHLRTLI